MNKSTTDVHGSVARAPRTAILLNARAAQAGQAVLLKRALPRPVLLLGQLVPLNASSRVMRPVRTAVTTAALRRTTQRLVFGGGRSSLMAGASGGDRSSALFTMHTRSGSA